MAFGGVAVTGAEQVVELAALHRILDALHVEPEVAGVGRRERRQTLAGHHRPEPIGRPALGIGGPELQLGLLAQLMEGLGGQAGDHGCGG